MLQVGVIQKESQVRFRNEASLIFLFLGHNSIHEVQRLLLTLTFFTFIAHIGFIIFLPEGTHTIFYG